MLLLALGNKDKKSDFYVKVMINFFFPAQGPLSGWGKDRDQVNTGFTKIIIQFSNSLKHNFSPVSKVDVDRFYPSDVRLDFPVTPVLIWVENTSRNFKCKSSIQG